MTKTRTLKKPRLVILDRDGVINEDSDEYIKTPAEWIPLPGSIEAVAQLSRAGFTVAVATNQSGLARGLFDEEALAAMHDKCRRLVEAAGGSIAGFFHCPHHPDDNCDCRKPATGLIAAVERALGMSAVGAPLIGDSLRDLQAALAHGCRPILVRTGNGESTLRDLDRDNDWSQLLVFDDLSAAADHLIDNAGDQ